MENQSRRDLRVIEREEDWRYDVSWRTNLHEISERWVIRMCERTLIRDERLVYVGSEGMMMKDEKLVYVTEN